jgi:hypothetical protein
MGTRHAHEDVVRRKQAGDLAVEGGARAIARDHDLEALAGDRLSLSPA